MNQTAARASFSCLKPQSFYADTHAWRVRQT